MNTLKEFLSSLIRYVLGAMFGALVVRNVIPVELAERAQNEFATQAVAWILTCLIPLAWSYAKNRGWLRKIDVALSLPASTDPDDLNEILKAVK